VETVVLVVVELRQTLPDLVMDKLEVMVVAVEHQEWGGKLMVAETKLVHPEQGAQGYVI